VGPTERLRAPAAERTNRPCSGESGGIKTRLLAGTVRALLCGIVVAASLVSPAELVRVAGF
jgi:hypothetical protein